MKMNITDYNIWDKIDAAIGDCIYIESRRHVDPNTWHQAKDMMLDAVLLADGINQNSLTTTDGMIQSILK